MSKTIEARFVVHGDFITDTARRLWNEEDEPERAMNILRCMQGITDAQCLEILEGKFKLVGDSSKGIRMVADKKKGKSVTDVIRKFREERDEARDDREDLTQMAIGDTAIVGSPTGPRRVPRRKTDRLRAGGATLAPGYDFDDCGNRDPKAKSLRVWQQVDGFLGADPARARAAIRSRGIEEEEDDEEEEIPPPPEPEAGITSPTGWLSPDGKFYPCGYSQHAQTAWKLRLTDNPQNHWVKPDGWIRLSKDGENQLFFPDDADTHSPAQEAAITTYCREKKIEVPWWLRKEAP